MALQNVITHIVNENHVWTSTIALCTSCSKIKDKKCHTSFSPTHRYPAFLHSKLSVHPSLHNLFTTTSSGSKRLSELDQVAYFGTTKKNHTIFNNLHLQFFHQTVTHRCVLVSRPRNWPALTCIQHCRNKRASYIRIEFPLPLCSAQIQIKILSALPDHVIRHDRPARHIGNPFINTSFNAASSKFNIYVSHNHAIQNMSKTSILLLRSLEIIYIKTTCSILTTTKSKHLHASFHDVPRIMSNKCFSEYFWRWSDTAQC